MNKDVTIANHQNYTNWQRWSLPFRLIAPDGGRRTLTKRKPFMSYEMHLISFLITALFARHPMCTNTACDKMKCQNTYNLSHG